MCKPLPRLRMIGLVLLFALFSSHVYAAALPLSENLDLSRFMGKWYVIANIPTYFEKDAFAAVEEYEWVETVKGRQKISTRFSYRLGSFNGQLKEIKPTAFVSNEHDAVWKMQFVWPFKADYRVMYVDAAHTVAIVGRNKRDYVWLMSRSPQLDETTLSECIARIEQAGYDIGQLRLVPQPEAPVAQELSAIERSRSQTSGR